MHVHPGTIPPPFTLAWTTRSHVRHVMPGGGHGLWHAAAGAALPPALTALVFRGHETGGLAPDAWPRLAGCGALARLALQAVLEVPAALAAALLGLTSLQARLCVKH